MDEGILSLKWNNHNSTFIHTLSTLHRMEMYSDVTLACEGKYFSVHKLVLSVCSEYFEEILSRTKCQHPVVVLKDIKHSDLDALLNYMYAGEANVAQSELSSLIKAAECLRIKGLAVPDETPPMRDKRRHADSVETSHSTKRRRNDILENNSNNSVNKYQETNENLTTGLSEGSKCKRRQEDSVQVEESHIDTPISSLDEKKGDKRIPEIILEDQSIEVKQEVAEPKIEELDDSHPHVDVSNINLEYSIIAEEEGNEGNMRNQGQDSQSSHILPDLMPHSVPGPSGVQVQHESIPTWDSNSSNLPGYSVDGYSAEELSVVGRVPLTSLQQQQHLTPQHQATQHQQSTNPQQTVLECPYCPRAFLYRSDLTRHLRSHTGEKPFTCPFCSYRGTQKTHLHEHIKRKHKTVFVDHHDSSGVSTIPFLHLPLIREDTTNRAASPVPEVTEATLQSRKNYDDGALT